MLNQMMRSRGALRTQSAFSLIELLVVISIIALLIAVLLPALSAARKQAQAVMCLANVRQIDTAALMYAHDHDGMWIGWTSGIDRKMLLYPYLKQGESNADVALKDIWQCPSNARPAEACGYGFNTNLNWIKLVMIRTPSHTVTLCDGGIQAPGVPTLTTMMSPPSMTLAGYPPYRPNPRHPSRTVSVGFVDGHIEPMPMKMPFYPGPVGQWTGNDITDPANPAYKDQLWDLR